MPRPSRQLDQAMLAAGRELFPAVGCGLSVRAVAERAGAAPGLFHYHFGSKQDFLRALLQDLYDEGFEPLRQAAAGEAPPLERLRAMLWVIARFVRDEGEVVGRIWSDAAQGEPVAVEFVRRNAPRHLQLLLGVLAEAERAGALTPMAPLRRMGFVMGAVAAPLLVASRLRRMDLGLPMLRDGLAADVLSDQAIDARIDMALNGLQGG